MKIIVLPYLKVFFINKLISFYCFYYCSEFTTSLIEKSQFMLRKYIEHINYCSIWIFT